MPFYRTRDLVARSVAAQPRALKLAQHFWCWPRMLFHVISIPFIVLHSTHTALQLPQSPLLPCRSNISFSANSYPLKRQKFRFVFMNVYRNTSVEMFGPLAQTSSFLCASVIVDKLKKVNFSFNCNSEALETSGITGLLIALCSLFLLLYVEILHHFYPELLLVPFCSRQKNHCYHPHIRFFWSKT